MLARLFQQLLNSCGVVFRTFRAFFTRQFMGLHARIRRITSFSRQAARLVPKAMSSLAVAGQKPTKREDFVETKRLFVAKSFLVMLAAGVVVLGLLAYFVLWPWLVSRFFTAHLFEQASALQTYTGKVVIYYDEEKKSPRMEGRLQDGLLQGEGKEYDEAGRLRYMGSFVDGQYAGEGNLYAEGVLCYKGEFAEGACDGQGVAYYPDGGQKYRGAFVQGQYEGEGSLYYENGQLQYKGQFSAGLFEGEGRLYGEDGSLLYEGAFQGGLYAGEGKLRIGRQLQLAGQFENGEPLGEVALYRAGKLCYQGEVQERQPSGLGTLYASDGTAIYTGSMQQGMPDFASLLEQSGDAVRAAFAEASLTETAGADGFTIQNAALGVTLFCSYKTAESDPVVYRIYCYGGRDNPFVQNIPWQNAQGYEAQAQEYEKQESEDLTGFPAGVPFPEGVYHSASYQTGAYTLTGWSRPGETDWFMVEWSVNRELPANDPSDTGEGGADEPADRLERLLQNLGLSEGSADAAAVQTATQEEGLLQPSTAQLAAEQEERLRPIVEYYLQSETLGELEQQIALKTDWLATEKTQDLMGKGSEELLEGLADGLAQLEIQAGRAEVALERLKMENPLVESADYEKVLQALLLPPDEFGAAALQSAGGGKAGELALIELELAWQTIEQANRTYEQAAEAAETAQTDYKTGAGEQAAVYEALGAESEAAVGLHETLYAYALQILEFNTMTRGYLSNQYGWQQALES